MIRKGDETPMQFVPITPSGRLIPERRDPNVNNLPEGGDLGAENEYSCNHPQAWRDPKPVDTEPLLEEYYEWRARHMEEDKEKENPGYRM